jgi:hypothetical protein
MGEKIIGYVLLAFSIVVIVGTAINTYFVFIGQASPVDVFGFLGELNLLPAAAQVDSGIDSASLAGSLNVFAHLFLMGFISSAAFKIGSLGVMMIRPIKVKLNQS